MRWLRWAAGIAVAVALLGFTAAVFLIPGGNCDAIASVTVGPQFTGEVTARHGEAVTFRIDEVLSDPVFLPDQGLGLEPGQEVVVRYGDDARFLHTGQAYLVSVSGNSIDDLRGSISHGLCGASGVETRHVDGSEINTSVLTRDGFEPYWTRLAVAIIAIAGAALLIRWRINARHPHLTIDGQPLTKKR
jgi:hypothetical protein